MQQMNFPIPDISVIIVSYNVQRYLCNCIDSLLAQEGVNTEIIVVDNNSTDGTQKLMREKYPGIKFIANTDNIGFSAANNRGIKEASASVIALLNPDTELPANDILLKAKEYIMSNPEMAILATELLNTDGTFQPSFWNFHSIKKWVLELFYLHLIVQPGEPESAIPVDAASGAALFFRKSLVDEIGGLDETMFWTEDIDFCYRAAKTGKKIIWSPAIKIIHHGGKSSVGNESVTIPNQVLSKLKFSRKHDTRMIFIIVNMLAFLFICSRLFIFILFSFINKKYHAKRKAYSIALKAYFRFNFKSEEVIIK